MFPQSGILIPISQDRILIVLPPTLVPSKYVNQFAGNWYLFFFLFSPDRTSRVLSISVKSILSGIYFPESRYLKKKKTKIKLFVRVESLKKNDRTNKTNLLWFLSESLEPYVFADASRLTRGTVFREVNAADLPPLAFPCACRQTTLHSPKTYSFYEFPM